MKHECGKGMQAHHIVPDYTLRFGNRGEAEANQKRILADPAEPASSKNYLTFANGMCICLQGNASLPANSALAPDDPKREHSAAHSGDIKIAQEGENNTPEGTLPVSRVIGISRSAVLEVRPERQAEIDAAILGEFREVDLKQLARSTQALPQGDALLALKAGKSQADYLHPR